MESDLMDIEIINDPLTPVQEFYCGVSAFVTGATGFIGRVLVEKLLRSCPEIENVYVLVRGKKEQDTRMRVEEMLQDILFASVKHDFPKIGRKVVAIDGDCGLPGLGIVEEDRKILIEKVSVVFHVAATVRFAEKIKVATLINVRGTRELLKLCKEIKNLKAVVHVSSAFSNCCEKVILEKFYPPPIDPKRLINLAENLDDDFFEDLTQKFLQNFPNTYTYTKAVAENLVSEDGKTLPIAVFRPAIVISTYKEPLKGWVNNLSDPAGIITASACGLLSSLHCDEDMTANIVPVNMCVNALVAIPWKTAATFQKRKEMNQEFKIPVYHYESSNDNNITWGEYVDRTVESGVKWPTTKAICLLKLYSRIFKLTNILSYFTTRNFEFKSERVHKLIASMTYKDKSIFFCDLRKLNWDHYFMVYALGMRLYLMKDPLRTLRDAKIKFKRLFWLHQIGKVALYCFLMLIVFGCILDIFSTKRIK